MSISPIIHFAKQTFSNNKINCLEIGARYEESSKIILQNFNVENYFIVEPYTSYDEYVLDGFNSIINDDSDDIIYKNVKSELTQLNKNVKFYRTFSSNINTISQIPNESIDFIFIDANYTYKYVLEDLQNYYPKLRENGIFCGDDFFMRSHENDIKKMDMERYLEYISNF